MDAPAPPAADVLAELSRLYIFKNTDPAALAALVEAGRTLSYAAGDVLFRVGDAADTALLVVSGRLVVELPAGDEARAIGDVRAGEITGETALLSHNGLRGATVTAAQDSVALELTPELMLELADNPSVMALENHLLGTMARRIREINLNIKKATREQDEVEPSPAAPQPSLLSRLRSFFGGGR